MTPATPDDTPHPPHSSDPSRPSHPWHVPQLDLPHDVDSIIYATMQQVVRLIDAQHAYRTRATEIPVTLADVEHTARAVLTSLVDQLAATLEYEAERIAGLGAPTPAYVPPGTDWTRAPLPPGMTRNQCLEQSTAFAQAAILVRNFVRWAPRPHPDPNTCSCCQAPLPALPSPRYRSDRAPGAVCWNCSFENGCAHPSPRTSDVV